MSIALTNIVPTESTGLVRAVLPTTDLVQPGQVEAMVLAVAEKIHTIFDDEINANAAKRVAVSSSSVPPGTAVDVYEIRKTRLVNIYIRPFIESEIGHLVPNDRAQFNRLVGLVVKNVRKDKVTVACLRLCERGVRLEASEFVQSVLWDSIFRTPRRPPGTGCCVLL